MRYLSAVLPSVVTPSHRSLGRHEALGASCPKLPAASTNAKRVRSLEGGSFLVKLTHQRGTNTEHKVWNSINEAVATKYGVGTRQWHIFPPRKEPFGQTQTAHRAHLPHSSPALPYPVQSAAPPPPLRLLWHLIAAWARKAPPPPPHLLPIHIPGRLINHCPSFATAHLKSRITSLFYVSCYSSSFVILVNRVLLLLCAPSTAPQRSILAALCHLRPISSVRFPPTPPADVLPTSHLSVTSLCQLSTTSALTALSIPLSPSLSSRYSLQYQTSFDTQVSLTRSCDRLLRCLR